MPLRPLAVIAVLVSQFIAANVFADDVLLRITLQKPISSPIGQNLLEFKQEVEEKTKGSIKVKVYDKAEFCFDYQVPQMVGSGAIEMGVVPLAQYAEEIPSAGLFMQPFLFNFDAIVRAATSRKSEVRTSIDSEIEAKAEVRVLWWQPYGPTFILGKGSLANPRAIAKRKIRVFDELSAEFVRLCGGTPHVVSDTNQAKAFDLNVVDSSVASIGSLKDDELWKRVDTITNIHHSENIFLVVVNKNIFDRLQPEQQRALIAVAVKVEDSIWSKFQEIAAENYAFAASKGIKIHQLTPDDTIAWRICSSSILESSIERAGALGARLFAAYRRLRTDPCCSKQATERTDNGK